MIWELPSREGEPVHDFDGLETMEMECFSSLFQNFDDVNIDEVLKIASYFPKRVDDNICEELY